MKSMMVSLFILSVWLISFSLGAAPLDNIVTTGLWHMDETLADGFMTPDDDSNNPGRDRDLTLFYSGTNPNPPVVVAGKEAGALAFSGENIAIASNFWNSSYTEFYIEYWLYLYSTPTDLGSAIMYLFSSSLFESAVWPRTNATTGANEDYMRFKIYTSSGNHTGEIMVADLKNQWLHVVQSYDASRHYVFTITDESGGVRSVTFTGSSKLKSVTCGFQFGYTPGKPSNRGFRGMIDEVKISNSLTIPHQAYSPVPAQGATLTEPPAVLRWSPGYVAAFSDVYLGNNSANVAAGVKYPGDIDGSTMVDLLDFNWLSNGWGQVEQSPCVDINHDSAIDTVDLAGLQGDWLADPLPWYLGGTGSNTLPAPKMAPATQYYWRVASANCDETDPGVIWSFTTGSARSTSPAPANNATGVSTMDYQCQLGWTPGFGADSFNVYFGTNSDPGYYTNVAEPLAISPDLQPGKRYYWRVDTLGESGVTEGTVWSFTTGAMIATHPTPAQGATKVTYPLEGVQLSWSSDFAPQAYHVYFGSENPPAYLGSTTDPDYLTPAVDSNTTYYWRVDAVDPLGTVVGPVWSFSTTTPAFPTAEGFGRFASGGRGGTVYHVTTLNDSGSGSFRDAVSQSNRTIVFDVGGQIVLSSRLGITKNNLTIAGQTAPGQGISIAGPGISVGADNLIIRYLRVRYTNSDTQDDTFSLNDTCENIIIDHLSTSWGTDEVFSITGSQLITAQWCIIAEGQNTLGHSKGSLLEWPQLTMHHCLYAHNNDRNPKSKGVFDYRNNVAYDWGFAPFIAGGGSAGMSYANCVGNYYIAGASSTTRAGVMVILGNSNYHMYFENNRIDSNQNGVADGVDLGLAMIDPEQPLTVMAEPYAYPVVATDSPEVAYLRVLQYAGCSLQRDAIDTRIVNQVKNQTGGIVYHYNDVGGLGTIAGGAAPVDTDQDGMPDSWEDGHDGLSKTNPDDRNGDPDGDGYTNLEDYLNSIAP